jgi:hypothetical protein
VELSRRAGLSAEGARHAEYGCPTNYTPPKGGKRGEEASKEFGCRRGFPLRWTATVRDVNYDGGGKPPTQVEIEGELMFKDIGKWAEA